MHRTRRKAGLAAAAVAALLAAALAAAPARAAGPTLDLSGERCGDYVLPGESFTVRGTAGGLSAGGLVGFRAALGVDGLGAVAAPAYEDFTVLPEGLQGAVRVGPEINGNVLSFGVITLNAGAPTAAAMALFEMRFVVLAGASGEIAVSPAAGSGGAFADREFDFAPGAGCVVGIASAPVADAGPDAAVDEGAAVFLDGGGSLDRAGEANLAYRWSIASGAGLLGSAKKPVAVYRAPLGVGDGATRLRLTVTDPDTGLSSFDEVAILVRDVPLVCTDSDGDGYYAEGGECGPADCADENPTIHPGITRPPTGEIPESCLRAADCGTLSASGGAPGALAALLVYGMPIFALRAIRARVRG